MKPKVLPQQLRILAATSFFAMSVGAHAASATWLNTGATNGNWSTGSNWGSGTAPGSTSLTTNTDVATFNTAVGTFGTSGNPIIIDNAAQDIGGISFDTSADSYFIGSTTLNTLKLTSGGTIQILSTLSSTNAVETINSKLSIQAANGTYTFANNSANGAGVGAGTLNFGGTISGAAAGATTLNLSGTNTNANTISGIISNGTATTLGITKSGAGTWVLSAANTYTGNTTVSAGTLALTNALALQNSALDTTGTGVVTLGSPITTALTLGGLAGSVDLVTKITTGYGGITALTLNPTVSTASNTYSGGIANGAMTLTKTGAGTQILSGTNTYTGITTVSAGTLTFAKTASLYSGTQTSWVPANISVASGAILGVGLGASASGFFDSTALNALLDSTHLGASTATTGLNTGAIIGLDTTNATSGTFTHSSVLANLSGGNIMSIAKLGVGTLILDQTNTYTGVTMISGGTLSVATIGNGGLAGNLGQAASTATNIVFNGGTLKYTGATATSDRAFTINAGTTATIDSANDLTLAGATGTATTGTLTKIGNGTLTLTGANTFTGNISVTAGTLKIGDGIAATGKLGNGTYTGNIAITSGKNFIYSSLATQTLSGAISGAGGTFTVDKGIIQFTGGANKWNNGPNLVINSGATFDLGNCNGQFSAQALAISGAGTFKYSGSNVVFMANGAAAQTIDMSAGGKLWVASGTMSDFNVKTTNVGDLQLDGILQQPNVNEVRFNSFNGTSTGQYIFQSSSSTSQNGFGLRVGVGANGGGGTFAGVIKDVANATTFVAGFTKVGSGTQVLSGANTYKGATNVQDGTLQLGGADNRLSSSTVLTLGNLTTSGKLILGSSGVAGVTDSKSDLTVAGLLTSGTGIANAIVGGNASVSTLNVNLASGTNTFAGTLGGGGTNENNLALTKSGAGTQIFSGASTYSGATNVQNGTLQLGGADNRLSSSTFLTLGNLATSGKLILGSTGVANVTNSRSDLTVAGLQTSGSGTANAIVGGNASISTLTVNLASGANTFSGTLGGGGANENNLALTKSGAGTLTFSGTNSYTGATLVSAGTLLVNGSLGATAVTVGATATVGGTGIINGSIDFDAGSTLNILDINDALSITGNVTFDGFGFSNITGWDYTTASNGTYTLLAGSNINLANVSNVGADNAYDLADGRSAYFQNGSLQVVIIPEPGAAVLGGLSLLALLRRRRH